jgi:hypothetical protein
MKIDFHIHTYYSYDGSSSPEEIVEAAIKKDINGICITDHGQIKGAIEAMKYGFDKNILVIPGIEIKTKSGDILGINIKKRIPDGLSAEESIKEIRKQGGIAVIAHPFGWWPWKFKGNEKEILGADGVEIFNAFRFNFSNKKAFRFVEKNQIPFTAGSDAHRAEFVGRGYLEIPKDNLSEKEVIEEIMNKNVVFKGKLLNPIEKIRNNLRRIVKFYIKNGFKSI